MTQPKPRPIEDGSGDGAGFEVELGDTRGPAGATGERKQGGALSQAKAAAAQAAQALTAGLGASGLRGHGQGVYAPVGQGGENGWDDEAGDVGSLGGEAGGLGGDPAGDSAEGGATV